jgi:hypothetical protein
MKFLREIFHQELDADGEIEIVGELFLRRDILKQLAPGPYEVAYAEWKERRDSALLEKASSILTTYDNRARFGQLLTTFKAGSMIPFIGAGMAMPSGFPSWSRFLTDLAKESHVPSASIETLLLQGRFEEAAQSLHDDLGAGLFNENVEVTFSKSCETDGAINYLPRLFPDCTILTTNFDSLLERIYGDQGNNGFDRIVSGASMSEALRQIASGSRILIKVHGDCRQVADRVLLQSEYERLYSDKRLVDQFFNGVIFRQSLLFLGCSLVSDRTVNQMKSIVREYGSERVPRHFALLELKRADDRVTRKKQLAEANIFPIWYPEGEHDESLEALFLEMLED